MPLMNSPSQAIGDAERIASKLEAKLAMPPDFRFYAYHTMMVEFCWTNGTSCIFGGMADEEYVRYPGPPEQFFVSEEYGWHLTSSRP